MPTKPCIKVSVCAVYSLFAPCFTHREVGRTSSGIQCLILLGFSRFACGILRSCACPQLGYWRVPIVPNESLLPLIIESLTSVLS